MLSNCIFACEGVKCSNMSDNLFSFKNIICNYHLKTIFGLKIWIFRSETETQTGLSGPFFIPDEHFSFKPFTVLFPERDFLDSLLMPENNSDSNANYMYELNPRIKTYLTNLSMQKLNFRDKKTYRYHYELIRNLSIKDCNNLNLIDQQDTSHTDLKTHIQDRISALNHWIKNEPYYKLFDKLSVLSISDPADNLKGSSGVQLETVGQSNDLTKFSPFYGFLFYNCLFDKNYMPLPDATASPLVCYGNLTYKQGIGIVAINHIVNPIPLVLTGRVTNAAGYYQMKTHLEPKQVVSNVVNTMSYPDNFRTLNIISSNEKYCNIPTRTLNF